MQRHMKVKTALAALAIAGGAAAAAIGPASPALGFFSPPLLLEIHVNSPATLIAKGASADVSLQIECAGTRTAFVDVSLTERAGSEIATGFGSTEVGCTNANQTIHVIVTAQSGKAFKKGTAVADGFIFACAPRFCGSEQDQRTIALVR
jgi:hypothetical protein